MGDREGGGLKLRKYRIIRINNGLFLPRCSELESEVEMLRMDVIQKRGVADSSQVANLSGQLEIVSRQIADLRGVLQNLF